MKEFRDISKLILSKETNEQLVEMYEEKGFLYFYIDEVLQWSSRDEVIYHEIMTIPYLNFMISKEPKKKLKILVLGRGDGFVVRELQKFDKNIKKIDMIDFDSEMVEIHKTNKFISILNENSLNYNKLNIYNLDASKYLKECNEEYDIIISDLVDPEMSIPGLYDEIFFNNIKRLLKNGIFISHIGDSIHEEKYVEKVRVNIKNVFGTSKKEKTFYYPIPSFGYYGFYTFTNNKNIKNIESIFNIKIDKSIKKKIKFLNNKNIKNIHYNKDIFNINNKPILKEQKNGKK